MKRKIKFLIIGVIIIIFAIAVLFLPVFPFKTVIHNGSGENFLIEKTLTNEAQINSICMTLERYGECYWKTKNKLRVPIKLYFDKDLRWNYTSKSEKQAERQRSAQKLTCIF